MISDLICERLYGEKNPTKETYEEWVDYIKEERDGREEKTFAWYVYNNVLCALTNENQRQEPAYLSDLLDALVCYIGWTGWESGLAAQLAKDFKKFKAHFNFYKYTL